MAMNDRTPMLEPAGANEKDGLATLYLVLGILFWVGGAATTALAILAYLDIGRFQDFFNTLLEDSVTVLTIVQIALVSWFGGLFLLTIGKFIRLLKRMGTLSYNIRGLDAVIPKTIEVGAKDGGKEKERPGAREKASHEERSLHGQGASRTMETGGVSITFNVQGAIPELGAAGTLPAVPASQSAGEESKDFARDPFRELKQTYDA